MNSFTLTAVGQLARNPELVARGDMAYTRFCLVGTDYAGKDDEGAAREVVTSLWFVAFGALGEAVARHSRKGDQLIVEARVRASIWTDKQGDKQYDHSFVVQGFRFGAPGRLKREERDSRRDDGHGVQRPEDRANGRDRSANGGAYTGFGARTGLDADARIGTRNAVRINEGANGAAGVEGAAGVGRVGSAIESSGARESRGADDSADADESAGGDRSVGADGSAGAEESSGADGSAGAAGGAGADGSAVVEGDAGMDGSAGAAGDAGTDGSADVEGDPGNAHPVSETRATTSRTRQKPGGSRSGRRASASAA
jgi:single-strand DNA-binding protein